MADVTQAKSKLPKDAKNLEPYCEDQGMPNIMGAAERGQSAYSFRTIMVAGGVITLPYKMADTAYRVEMHNHTTEAKQGKSAIASRTLTTITVAGPANDEVLEIFIQGTLKGQTA